MSPLSHTTSRQRLFAGSAFSLYFILSYVNVSAGAKNNPMSITFPSPHNNILQDWIEARCGPTGNAVWAYQGALYDPLDGKKIAQVEGLELVRCLATTDGSKESKARYRNRCGDLMMADAVANPKAKLDYAGTVLSRKLFCYKPVSNPRKLLKSIRLRPGSPERQIPNDQAAQVFDTASTFVQRGDEWIVHGEWPDGRAVWNQADFVEGAGDNGRRRFLDFTVYGRPRSNKRRQIPNLTRPPMGDRNSTTVASPARSSLIQFGASPKTDSDAKFGARESYQYEMQVPKEESKAHSRGLLSPFRRTQTSDGTIIKDTSGSCSVRYTRYGEGPVWYGPNRLCTLELTGKRVSGLSEAPPLAAEVAANYIPGFSSVHSPVSQDDERARRSVDWFRYRGSAELQILADKDDESISNRLQKRGATIVERIRAATTLSVGGDS